MPAFSRMMTKAWRFSGQERNSPALCMTRYSAPSLLKGILTCMPVFSSMSSSANSMMSATPAGFRPVDEPVLSCFTVPRVCSSGIAMPSSWLKSLRISRVMSPLSTPMGQVWAQRRHRVQRYDSSARLTSRSQLTSMSCPRSFGRMPPPGLMWRSMILRSTSPRKVGRYISARPESV